MVARSGSREVSEIRVVLIRLSVANSIRGRVAQSDSSDTCTILSRDEVSVCLTRGTIVEILEKHVSAVHLHSAEYLFPPSWTSVFASIINPRSDRQNRGSRCKRIFMPQAVLSGSTATPQSRRERTGYALLSHNE